MKFIIPLIALCLGLVEPARSAESSIVILRCSISGTEFNVTAASESPNARDADIGNSCAREMERYLRANFSLRNTQGAQNGSSLTYTLIGPP